MIRIVVFGDTYHARKVLNDHSFRYNKSGGCWTRVIKETDLNRVTDTLNGLQYYTKEVKD